VQIGELEWLVVDQDQHGLLGSEESVKAVLEGDGLRHGRHSGFEDFVARGVDIAALLVHD
jgi:hypothetical protein